MLHVPTTSVIYETSFSRLKDSRECECAHVCTRMYDTFTHAHNYYVLHMYGHVHVHHTYIHMHA